MQYTDWGQRCSRWAGIRSETVDVRGTDVHLFRTDAGLGAPVDAPTQLLVHPMASGGMSWLDVLRSLSAYGPVLAPDLPGAVFGHTPSPHPSATRVQSSARFLRALASTLDLDHLVVHGWSLGGLVALLFTDLQPERVDRLVLTAPTLPGPMTTGERAGWQTLGRLALLVGPTLVGVLIGVFGSAFVDAKRRSFDPRALAARGCSTELTTLFTEQLDELRAQPQRLRDFVPPFASAVSAMYVDRRPVLEVIDRVSAPTILLWGDQDPIVEHAVIDYLIARRPDWDLHIFNSVGHLPPWETPHAYAQAVGQWLAGPISPSGGAAEKRRIPASPADPQRDACS